MLQPCQCNLPHRVRSDIMFVQGSCHLLSLTDFLAFVTELTVFCSSRGPNCARDNRQMVLATLGWAGLFCLSADPGRSYYYESLQVNHPTTPTTHWKLKRPRVWMSSRIRTCEIVRLWDWDISVCLTKSGQVDHKADLVIGSETKLVMIESSYWGRWRE